VVTLLDVAAVFIMPLLIGSAAAWCFRHFATIGVAVGLWATIVTGFLSRLALDEWNVLDDNLKSLGGALECLQLATRQLVMPNTAIRWVPIYATVALAVTILRPTTDGSSSMLESKERNNVGAIALALVIVLLTGSMMTRALWTSIYLTETYTQAEQAGWIAVSALLLSAVWCAGAIRSPASEESQVGLISLGLLSFFGCVLLGSSGSISYAMLMAPTVAFPLVLMTQGHSQVGLARLSAGLVAVSMGLPVVLGHYFAEVKWPLGLMFFASLVLALAFWPGRKQTFSKRSTRVLLAILPALIATTIAVVAALNEIRGIPEEMYNPYQDL